MEIRDFAERVLFATTLEEKLAPPEGEITDEQRGRPISHPGLPGRPPDLVPRREAEARARFPAEARLIDERERAVLLHFFGNHELLAVELMALALLKFPEAPRSFRQGVLRTLQEEQDHTQWYRQRMAECGLTFGDLSVSRMIWDHIAPMESPLDYVSRLSLTFEQSNLDYAKHYAGVLGQVGDAASAKILERIYRDEIAHVGYGLKWLRRWKEESESDWEAFRRSLRFPLSPIRAKGLVPFNEEGRRLAGLGDDFIRKLRHFQTSRGRTPDVWFFNPTAENEWAAQVAGRPFHPPGRLEALAADLEPAFALGAAASEDIVLLRRQPDEESLERWRAVGLVMPEHIVLENGRLPEGALGQRALHAPRPWALSPGAHDLFAGKGKFHEQMPAGSAAWFSKELVADCLDGATALGRDIGPRPVVVRDHAGVAAAVEAILRDGWKFVLVKEARASAGSGNHLLDRPLAETPPWLERALLLGPVLVEPWLPVELAFSLHFDADERGLHFVGVVRQESDEAGRWLGAVVRPKAAGGLPRETAAMLARLLVEEVPGWFRQVLGENLARLGYRGPVGVDSLFWRDRDGALRWRPFVDINTRWTMGRLALSLRHRLRTPHGFRLSVGKPEQTSSLAEPVIQDGRLVSGTIVLGCPAAAGNRILVGEILGP